jgi:hypothetical protein
MFRFNTMVGRAPRCRAQARRRRPWLEEVEHRIVPATFHVSDVAGLQAAIAAVNANPTEQATVFLQQGTYALTSALVIEYASNLTIKGDASGKVIIDGGDVTSDFGIIGGNVSLFGLTITGGNADFSNGGGGGIVVIPGSSSHATVNVDNCNFTNDHADNSMDGGGAILFQYLGFSGTLNVDHSDFIGNHANNTPYGGGAILTSYATNTVNVAHSDFTGNSAAGSGLGGGGILIVGGGGAQAEIDFCTITGNTPDDLAFAGGGSAHLKETVVGTALYHDANLP